MFSHAVLIAGVIFLLGPIVLILFSATHDTATLQQAGLQWLPGGHGPDNYLSVLNYEAGFTGQVTPLVMLSNSLIIAVSVATLTTLFSFLTAYALVYCKMRLKTLLFWTILSTLLFPLESRFIATFQVASSLGLINTHIGIILPALAGALGTFFFRQYFLTVPNELLEAARLDGAGPIRFLLDIIMPLSRARGGAIFVISFMIGWNQYLWPMMISTDDSLYTLVRGIRLIGQNSGAGMALITLTIIPPLLLLFCFQRWFFSSLSGDGRGAREVRYH